MQVHGVDHWQTLELFEGRLQFQGVPGALVGPPWSKRENGWATSLACVPPRAIADLSAWFCPLECGTG